MKRFFITLSLLLLPLTAVFAAEPDPTTGTINIQIIDENGHEYPGLWALYQGTAESDLILRNGRKGETFEFPAGNYYLGVDSVVGTNVIGAARPEYIVWSDNPQTMEANGEITFLVQYFMDEEQKQAALNGTQPTPLTEAEAQSTGPAPEPVTETDEPEAIQMIVVPAAEPVIEHSFDKSLRQAILRAKNQNAANSLASGASAPQDLQLAATGSPALLIGIASVLGGALLTRKRK